MKKKVLFNKKVLVTGADGFIGSHLVEHLVKQGAKVKAFHYYNSWDNIGWLSYIPKGILKEIELINGDIRDSYRVYESVKGAEVIYHLASLIGIPYSYLAFRSYYETNVKGTLNILEACLKHHSFERLVHTSTSEVYGSAQKIPIDENHPIIGQSPYSASKIAADKLAESFKLSFNLPIITARPFNTFGPRQTSRAVIPTIISQIVKGNKVLNLGNIKATRDFNYVKDTVNSIYMLSNCKNAEGKIVNIGSGQEWSIKETAELIMRILKVSLPIRENKNRKRPKNSEVNRLIADNSLLKKLIKYRKPYSFERGLKLTVNWVLENSDLFEKDIYKV